MKRIFHNHSSTCLLRTRYLSIYCLANAPSSRRLPCHTIHAGGVFIVYDFLAITSWSSIQLNSFPSSLCSSAGCFLLIHVLDILQPRAAILLAPYVSRPSGSLLQEVLYDEMLPNWPLESDGIAREISNCSLDFDLIITHTQTAVQLLMLLEKAATHSDSLPLSLSDSPPIWFRTYIERYGQKMIQVPGVGYTYIRYFIHTPVVVSLLYR